jgi:hypothetical protein
MNHGKSARAPIVAHRDDNQFHPAVVFADIDEPIADRSRAPASRMAARMCALPIR